MVTMVMVVLWLMFEARKPETWRWMWGGQRQHAGQPLTEDELAEGDVDTRLRAPSRAADPFGTIVAEGDGPALWESDVQDEAEPQSDDERLERARQDGWKRVLNRLSSDDQQRLYALFKSLRDKEPLDADVQDHWPEVIEQLSQGWDDYLHDAFQYLVDAGDQLSAQQKGAWHAAVQRLELDWRGEDKPALEAAGAGDTLSPEHQQTLAELQEVLDAAALSEVRDDSVFRSAELQAWFRLLEQLDRRSLDQLEQDAVGRVGFLQLFKQSSQYRGQLVTVRGSAQLGYRVRAPKNAYGIDEYYVFWLRPAGGPNSPIAVYALEAPPGFPQLKDKDLDRGTTPLNEEVAFTGYFFKRWAYRAHDGLRIAPLILAKTPRWTAPAPVHRYDPTDPLTLAMCLLGAMAVAAVVALGAYWQGQRRSSKERGYRASAERLARRMQALEEEDPAEDVRENLRRLSEQQK